MIVIFNIYVVQDCYCHENERSAPLIGTKISSRIIILGYWYGRGYGLESFCTSICYTSLLILLLVFTAFVDVQNMCAVSF